MDLFEDDDIELYKHLKFEDSMQVIMYYLIFLLILKYYYN